MRTPQAQRLEATAEAGQGATLAEGRPSLSTAETEKAAEGMVPSLSGSSEEVAAPVEPKKVDEEPQRSKGKTALLMGALCVCHWEHCMSVREIADGMDRWRCFWRHLIW